MTSRRNLLLGMFLLMFIGIGTAQMTPQYSHYETYTLDDTNNIIYVTAVVDGTTTNCFGPCQAATHQGRVYVQIGNSSGWVYGPAVGPPTYISVSNQKSSAGIPGVDVSGLVTEIIFIRNR